MFTSRSILLWNMQNIQMTRKKTHQKLTPSNLRDAFFPILIDWSVSPKNADINISQISSIIKTGHLQSVRTRKTMKIDMKAW